MPRLPTPQRFHQRRSPTTIPNLNEKTSGWANQRFMLPWGMIWLALFKRFWILLPISIGLAFIVFIGHRLDVVKDERDKYQASALQWQATSQGWEASYRESEKLRGTENQSAVQAVNSSEASCDARVQAARDSATKIEHIVTKQSMECKPGEAIPRVLADPVELRGALGLR